MKKKIIKAGDYINLMYVKNPDLVLNAKPATPEEFIKFLKIADLNREESSWYSQYPTSLNLQARQQRIEQRHEDFIHRFKAIISINEIIAFTDYLSENLVISALANEPAKTVDYYFQQWIYHDRNRYYEFNSEVA